MPRHHQSSESAFGSFSLALPEGTATWSAGCARILGMTDAECEAGGGDARELLARLDPTDRKRVLQARAAAEAEAGIWRVVYATATVPRVVERGRIEFGEDGTPLRAEAILTIPESPAALRRETGLGRLTQMVGRVAHDFNNKLGIVLGSVDLARMSVNDEALIRRLDGALQATVDAAAESRLLLELARPTPRSVRRAALADIVRGLSVQIETHLLGRVDAVYRLDDQAPPVDVDRDDFVAAVLELVDNAVEAMPHGGRLAIDVGPTTALAGAPATLVCISDTGEGMSSDALADATRPWTTSRKLAEAPGLGLTMVADFVQRAGGQLLLRSDPGLGTAVEISLPASRSPDEGSDPAAREPEAPMPTANGERILVVDDELRLANATAALLAEEGYVTEVAGSAREALESLAARSFDLLFTDIVMPGGMNGLQLAEAVCARYPDVAILLTSGFTAGAGDPAAERHRLLDKPYPREILLRAVGEVLAERWPAGDAAG